MRLLGLALAGVLIAAAPARAQYVPRPAMPVGQQSAEDVSEIVQAMGLQPVGAPVARGPFFVQRARDDFGRVLRVTVDARRSQVIAVEAAGQPRAPYGTYGRAYPMPGAEASLEPPGSAMGARVPPHGARPPHSAAIAPDLPTGPTPSAVPAKPKAKSAAATPNPQTAPTPRKRPPAAPPQAAGSVEPMAGEPAATRSSAPQAAAPQAAPAAPAEPAKPQTTMPPVAPLE